MLNRHSYNVYNSAFLPPDALLFCPKNVRIVRKNLMSYIYNFY